MIFISMRGADGSSCVFVNNIPTKSAKQRKNAENRLEKPILLVEYLEYWYE